jgi:hypothetical protein
VAIRRLGLDGCALLHQRLHRIQIAVPRGTEQIFVDIRAQERASGKQQKS